MLSASSGMFRWLRTPRKLLAPVLESSGQGSNWSRSDQNHDMVACAMEELALVGMLCNCCRLLRALLGSGAMAPAVVAAGSYLLLRLFPRMVCLKNKVGRSFFVNCLKQSPGGWGKTELKLTTLVSSIFILVVCQFNYVAHLQSKTQLHLQPSASWRVPQFPWKWQREPSLPAATVATPAAPGPPLGFCSSLGDPMWLGGTWKSRRARV